MNRILLLFAHPTAERSAAGAALLEAAAEVEGVTIHDLYATYPDFYINVEKEQARCIEHDVILTQYPLYWYSSPSLLKEWYDLVLQHGWAYGSQGKALEGKYFLQAITAGAEGDSYSWQARSSMPFVHYLAPLRATARLCGMRWLPPFFVPGMHSDIEPERLAAEAEAYRQLLTALREGEGLTELSEACEITEGKVPDADSLRRALIPSPEAD